MHSFSVLSSFFLSIMQVRSLNWKCVYTTLLWRHQHIDRDCVIPFIARGGREKFCTAVSSQPVSKLSRTQWLTPFTSIGRSQGRFVILWLQNKLRIKDQGEHVMMFAIERTRHCHFTWADQIHSCLSRQLKGPSASFPFSFNVATSQPFALSHVCF